MGRYIIWPAIGMVILTLLSLAGLVFLAKDDGTGLPGGIWVVFFMVMMSTGNLVLSVLETVVRCRGTDWAVWLGYASSIAINALIGGCFGGLWRTMKEGVRTTGGTLRR